MQLSGRHANACEEPAWLELIGECRGLRRVVVVILAEAGEFAPLLLANWVVERVPLSVDELGGPAGGRIVEVEGCSYELLELGYCCGSRARDWKALQRRSPSHVASFVRSRLHFGFLASRPFGLPACWEGRELLSWCDCVLV